MCACVQYMSALSRDFVTCHWLMFIHQPETSTMTYPFTSFEYQSGLCRLYGIQTCALFYSNTVQWKVQARHASVVPRQCVSAGRWRYNAVLAILSVKGVSPKFWLLEALVLKTGGSRIDNMNHWFSSGEWRLWRHLTWNTWKLVPSMDTPFVSYGWSDVPL